MAVTFEFIISQLKRRVCHTILIVLTGVYLNTHYAGAQNLIVTLDYSSNPVNSGFDGKSQLYGNGNIFLIPGLNGGSGFGISIGGAREMRNFVYAAFKYSLTAYDAYYQNEHFGRTFQNSFGAYIRLYPRRFLPYITDAPGNSRLQLYFLTGVDVGILKVKNCHYLESNPEVLDDAIFTSLVLPAGMGLSIKLPESFTLDIDAAYKIG